jgi:hypothetical protein
VLFKLALALHMSLRFAEANETYQRAFEHWTPAGSQRAPDADLRVATSFLLAPVELFPIPGFAKFPEDHRFFRHAPAVVPPDLDTHHTPRTTASCGL